MGGKKVNRIPYLLMVGSAVLLFGFLLFWLSREYYIEKEILSDELLEYYNESVRDVQDSFLQEIIYAFFGDQEVSRREAFRTIRPFLFDSSRASFISRKFSSSDSVHSQLGLVSGQIVSHVIKKSDSVEFDDKYPDSILIARVSHVSGAKIFKDPEGYKSNMLKSIPVLVLEDVKNKLAYNNLRIKVEIVKDMEEEEALIKYPSTIVTNDRRMLSEEHQYIAWPFGFDCDNPLTCVFL